MPKTVDSHTFCQFIVVVVNIEEQVLHFFIPSFSLMSPIRAVLKSLSANSSICVISGFIFSLVNGSYSLGVFCMCNNLLLYDGNLDPILLRFWIILSPSKEC